LLKGTGPLPRDGVVFGCDAFSITTALSTVVNGFVRKQKSHCVSGRQRKVVAPLASGMAAWLEPFRSSVLELLPQEKRAGAIEQIVTLLKPALCDREGHWTADYVRLRLLARRP
jgi:hypothetical protein